MKPLMPPSSRSRPGPPSKSCGAGAGAAAGIGGGSSGGSTRRGRLGAAAPWAPVHRSPPPQSAHACGHSVPLPPLLAPQASAPRRRLTAPRAPLAPAADWRRRRRRGGSRRRRRLWLWHWGGRWYALGRGLWRGLDHRYRRRRRRRHRRGHWRRRRHHLHGLRRAGSDAKVGFPHGAMVASGASLAGPAARATGSASRASLVLKAYTAASGWVGRARSERSGSRWNSSRCTPVSASLSPNRELAGPLKRLCATAVRFPALSALDT